MNKPNNNSNNQQRNDGRDNHGNFQRGSNIPSQNNPPKMPDVKSPKKQ